MLLRTCTAFSVPLFFLLFFSLLVQVVPRPGRHRRPMTATKTQKDKASKAKKVLLTALTVVVLLGILVTAGYFSESQFLTVVSSFKDTATQQDNIFTALHCLDTSETCFAKVLSSCQGFVPLTVYQVTYIMLF